MNPKLP